MVVGGGWGVIDIHVFIPLENLDTHNEKGAQSIGDKNELRACGLGIHFDEVDKLDQLI